MSRPTMKQLAQKVCEEFRGNTIPTECELVVFDGVDQLGKEYLKERLLGKSQDEVYQLMRDGKLGNGSSLMEELQNAEPIGLKYYLEPFLRYFAFQLEHTDRPIDEEFPFFLFFEILNILKRKGTKIFTESQITALIPFIESLLKECKEIKDGNWSKDVEKDLIEIQKILLGGSSESAEPAG